MGMPLSTSFSMVAGVIDPPCSTQSTPGVHHPRDRLVEGGVGGYLHAVLVGLLAHGLQLVHGELHLFVRSHDLDPLGARLELLADRLAHPVDAVGLATAPPGVAAGGADGPPVGEEADPGRPAVVDGDLGVDVGVVHAQIPDGGDPRRQGAVDVHHRLHGVHGRRLVGLVLQVVGAVPPQVDVTVSHAGQQVHAGEVHHLVARLGFGGAHRRDLLVFDYQVLLLRCSAVEVHDDAAFENCAHGWVSFLVADQILPRRRRAVPTAARLGRVSSE